MMCMRSCRREPHGWKVDVIMLPESISDKLSRYLRGGAFNYRPTDIREAVCNSNGVTFRNIRNGFRLARTCRLIDMGCSDGARLSDGEEGEGPHSTVITPFITIQWPGKVQRKG